MTIDTDNLTASHSPDPNPLVRARGLHIIYPNHRGMTKAAVAGVDLTIARGETLALVGESGCGKTSLGRALLGLIPIARGEVAFDGCPWTNLSIGKERRQRARAQLVFQDAGASLNPRWTIGASIAEPLRLHRRLRSAANRQRVEELLERVGLARTMYARYPHELSGGEKQRVGIARALALDPEFIVLDEPVSAVDAVMRVKLLDLLRSVQVASGCSYLLITHDLAVARYMSDRVAVMHAGQIVEFGQADQVLRDPRHPQTRILRAGVPRLARPTAVTPN